MSKKATTTKKRKKKTELEKQVCTRCNESKRLIADFYSSASELYQATGKVPICKACLKDMVAADNINVKEVLRMIDKPYLADVWLPALQKNSGDVEKAFGVYIRQINSLPQYRNMTFKHSSYQASEGIEEKLEEIVPKPTKRSQLEALRDKWGHGYTSNLYEAFERKYDSLINNYAVKTALHDEALKTYIRYRVREEAATAEGDTKAAQDWGKLANQAATSAKLNPNQLSKNDLNDGLDNFGVLAKMVEQAVDIVPILPQFKERPQDQGDFVLWQLVNYARDLKNLPYCDYNEIYKFYEDRRKEYEERIQYLNEEDGDEDEDETEADA